MSGCRDDAATAPPQSRCDEDVEETAHDDVVRTTPCHEDDEEPRTMNVVLHDATAPAYRVTTEGLAP